MEEGEGVQSPSPSPGTTNGCRDRRGDGGVTQDPNFLPNGSGCKIPRQTAAGVARVMKEERTKNLIFLFITLRNCIKLDLISRYTNPSILSPGPNGSDFTHLGEKSLLDPADLRTGFSRWWGARHSE